MSDRYVSIETALQHASVQKSLFIPPDGRLIGARDDVSVRLNANFNPELHQVVTSDPDEYPALVQAGFQAVGLSGDIEPIVRHERQLAEAAKGLGSIAVYYGVSFVCLRLAEGKIGKPWVQPFTASDVEVTRMEAALIAAHPAVLTLGDRLHMQAYGFASIDVLGKLAVMHNMSAPLKRYPVPLSYTGEELPFRHCSSETRFGHPGKREEGYTIHTEGEW